MAVAISIVALLASVSHHAVTAAGPVTLTATLAGSNSVPPVPSTATGSATITVDTATNTVHYSVQFSGLSSGLTASHIHQGAAGTNGPVVVPFAIGTAAGQTSGSFSGDNTTAPMTIVAELASNPSAFYVNVHSTTFPAGEIRGQLALSSSPPGTATPELASGDLLAAGLVPVAAVIFLRRRRARRAA
jgi:Cu/Zn superoxide dismutase